MMRRGDETPEEEKARFKESRALRQGASRSCSAARPTSSSSTSARRRSRRRCFTVKPFGKVVICGATSGYTLDFDVRYLWMRQKQIIGSHFANAWECTKANELIEQGKIRPVLWRTMGFDQVAEAHQLMHENKHLGQDRDPRRRRPRRARARPRDGPGAIRAEVGEPDGRRRPHPLVRDGLPRRQARRRRWRRSRRSRCATARRTTRLPHPRRPLQVHADRASSSPRTDWERYWYGPGVHRLPRGLLELVPGAGAVRLDRARRRRGAWSPSTAHSASGDPVGAEPGGDLVG